MNIYNPLRFFGPYIKDKALVYLGFDAGWFFFF